MVNEDSIVVEQKDIKWFFGTKKVFHVTFKNNNRGVKHAESLLYRIFPGAVVKTTKDSDALVLESGDRPWKNETAESIKKALLAEVWGIK